MSAQREIAAYAPKKPGEFLETKWPSLSVLPNLAHFFRAGGSLRCFVVVWHLGQQKNRYFFVLLFGEMSKPEWTDVFGLFSHPLISILVLFPSLSSSFFFLRSPTDFSPNCYLMSCS